MYPVLFGEGVWALPSYFTMVMVGFVVGISLARRQAEQAGWNVTKVIDLSLIILVMSILGARLTHVVFDGYLHEYIELCRDPQSLAKLLPSGAQCTSDAACVMAQNTGADIGENCIDGYCVPTRDCFRALKFWSGGLTYYGGFVFAFLTSVFLTRCWRMSFLKFADFAAPAIAIGVAFGRIGCFLAGCCFGKVTDVPWAVKFPLGSDAWKHQKDQLYDLLVAQHEATGQWTSLPVHPTQLYEALGCICIFLFIWFVLRKKKLPKGISIAFLLISYGVVRFIIEFFRDDMRGGYILSTSQWISIPLVLLGVGLIIRGYRHPKDDGPELNGFTPEEETKKKKKGKKRKKKAKDNA